MLGHIHIMKKKMVHGLGSPIVSSTPSLVRNRSLAYITLVAETCALRAKGFFSQEAYGDINILLK
jgi:hypothetical protein